MKSSMADWECELCGKRGEFELQSDFGINEIVIEILLAHECVSPKCKAEAHMVNEIDPVPAPDIDRRGRSLANHVNRKRNLELAEAK